MVAMGLAEAGEGAALISEVRPEKGGLLGGRSERIAAGA